MCQHFCKALPVVGESKTHNAYGLSPVEGALDKVAERMRQLKKGECDFYCYSDDTDFYYRDRDNDLFRVSPDFTQMDGSIDADTVYITIKWICRCFASRFGESQFWHHVASEWYIMATKPHFVCDGPTVYMKAASKPSGVMSGVVGTTLFGTVKSVLTYAALSDDLAMGSVTLQSEKKMRKVFLERYGLVLKEKTWKWHKVNEEPVPGVLWTPATFLGVQWKYMQGSNRCGLVPCLDQERFLKLVINPRRDEKEVRNKLNDRYRTDFGIKENRYIFDWARGLMVSVGFADERQSSMLNAILNKVPATAVLMEVQANGGKGEPPDCLALMEKFGTCDATYNYVDSQGVPTPGWVLNLYLAKDNRWPDSYENRWQPLYPSLSSWMSEQRKKERVVNPLFVIRTGDSNWIAKTELPSDAVKAVVEVAVAPCQETVLEGDIVMERAKEVQKIQEKRVKFPDSRGPKIDYPTKTPRVRDPTVGQQLKALIHRAYDRMRQNVKEERDALPPEERKKVKYPKWSTFGISVKEIRKETGWDKATTCDAADEIGYLVQDGYIVKNIVVNDRISEDFVETQNRLEKRVKDPVVSTSKDRNRKNAVAEQTYREKFDRVGLHVAPKVVPAVEVTWQVIPTPLRCFFDLVKKECERVEPKVKTPDGYWAALTSHTFTLRASATDEEVHFRLKFDCDTVNVDQRQGRVKVTNQMNVWVSDYTTGRKEGHFHEEAIPLCLVVGSNKEWNKKVLKNALLNYFFPKDKAPLYCVETADALVVTEMSDKVKELKGRVICTFFSTQDREPDTGNWFHDSVEEERMASRKPVILNQDPVLNAPKTKEYLNTVVEQEFETFDEETAVLIAEEESDDDVLWTADNDAQEIFVDDVGGEESNEEVDQGEEETSTGAAAIERMFNIFFAKVEKRFDAFEERLTSLETKRRPRST